MATDMRFAGRPGRSGNWGWVLAIGIVMLIAGVAALFLPGLATLSASLALGWILLLYGIAGIVMGVKARHGRGHGIDLLYGILSLVAGLVLLFFPLSGVLSFTLAVAAWLLARGVIELITGFRYAGERALMLIMGVLDLILGVILVLGWPFPAVQLVGIFIGISFIMGGVATIVAAFGLKRLADQGA